MAETLGRADEASERRKVLERIEIAFAKVARDEPPLSAYAAEERRNAVAAAVPLIGELARARLQESLAAHAADADTLTSFVGDVGLVEVPEACLSAVLRALRLVASTQGKIPGDFQSGKAATRHEVPTAYDPNTLIRVVSNVRLKSGFVLDYVWRGTHHEGSPLLYARREADSPISSVEGFGARLGVEPKGFAPDYPVAYFPAFEFPSSPLAAVELAVVINEARFFYWFWHAMYERVELTVTATDRAEYLETLDGAGRSAVEACKLGARVRWSEDQVIVEMLTHSDEGYAITKWRMGRDDQSLEVTHEAVAESDVVTLY